MPSILMTADRVWKDSMAKDPKPEKKPAKQPELPAQEFDFAQYKQAILDDPRARKVVEDFLKYRHRESEKNL
jgi:hypothetical protein